MSEQLAVGDAPLRVDAAGPLLQSAVIGFRVVYVVTLLLGLLWLASNCRVVSSDSQAVVMRFGRIVRIQTAGLLLALPRPIESVQLLPGAGRQLSRSVAALPPVAGLAAPGDNGPADAAGIPPGATPYLTGDGKVVLLDATLIYRIDDPARFVLARGHVDQAMDRVFRAAAVRVAAGQALNDFLVFQPGDGQETGASNEAVRGRVRDRLLDEVAARLHALAAQGQSLGIDVDRIDMTAWLPAEAKQAFDAVLTAGQRADQDIAAASTRAELRRQGARREADRILAAAQAAGLEQRVAAAVDTADILALESMPGAGEALEQRFYRDAIGGVLAKVGTVIVVDARTGQRMLLNGPGSSIPPSSR